MRIDTQESTIDNVASPAQAIDMKSLLTPDEQFKNLAELPFEPHYF